jgi:hypothetical protein
MIRLGILALVILLSLGASALSAMLQQHDANQFIVLFSLEPLIVLAGGALLTRHLLRQPGNAAGMLGVGLYILAVGTAFITVFPIWLPEDDTILGTAFLGALLAMIGTVLAVAASMIMRGRAAHRALGIGAAWGLLAFVLALASGAIAPVATLHAQFVLPAIVLISIVPLTRRQPALLVRPLLLSAAATALTLATLLMRGPGDWASSSTSVKLYSFPIVVMGCALCIAILTLATPRRT